MMLKIGEKIKELREKKSITQSKMAEYLGITEQAISRWENGGGYPDMELIPGISNFLDVSTDELFETDRKEERLRSLTLAAGKNLGWDHKSNCEKIEMYRDILKEFPNHYPTIFDLIVRLAHENYTPLGQHSEEIIALSNRIINDCPDINLRRMATDTLAGAYKKIGEQEKAVQIIKESSIIHWLGQGIGFSRESILSTIAEGEEAWENRKDVLQHLCNELCNHIHMFSIVDQDSANDADISKEEWAEMIKRNIIIREKINKIIEVFYEDGDYGFFRAWMVDNYQALAEYYMFFGDHAKALDNIEKCAESAILFDTDKPGLFTSVLVKNIKKSGDYPFSNYGNHSENIRYNQSYHLVYDCYLNDNFWALMSDKKLSEDSPYRYGKFYAPIRETERFKAIIANLEKYAKVETID